jgi:hypothetical protein
MDELVKQISEKLSLSEDTARKAVNITDCYLAEQLPESIYKNVEMVLGTSDITKEETKELGLYATI